MNGLKNLDTNVCLYHTVAPFHSTIFSCNECGILFDIFENYEDLTKKKIEVGEIKSCQIYFYGYCNLCKKKKK